MKACRVITDEPIGICVGFRPSGVEFDEYELVENDSSVELDDYELFVFISLDNKEMAISVDDNWDRRKGNDHWNEWPEPEPLIWRTEADFEEWKEEMEL